MYPYEITGDDVQNNGKIVDVTCPNGQVKKLSIRFSDDCTTLEQQTAAIENAVNEVEQGFDEGTIVFQSGK